MLAVQPAGGTLSEAGGVFTGPAGAFIRTDRASTSLSTTGRVLLGDRLSQRQGTGEITLVAVLQRVAARPNGVLTTTYGAAVPAGHMSLQWFSDNRWYHDIGDEDSRVAQTDSFTGATVIVCSWSNTDKRKRLWRDGALIYNNTSDTDSISAGTTDYVALANGMGAYAFFVFDRRFENERDLSLRPWQLFARRRIWAPQAAGSPATFNPAWARNRNIIITGT